jgi:hypothetical protein
MGLYTLKRNKFLKRKFGKKGESIVLMIFEIIVVIFIIWVTFGIAKAYGSSETTVKVNTANDYTLMLNALIATPGDVTMIYPGETHKYTVALTNTYVTVFLEDDSVVERVRRYYSLPKGYDATGAIQNSPDACLEKKGTTIILKEC